MLKNLQKLRIEKRLRKSSRITLLLSGVASVIAVIFMIIIIVRYNYTLTYYAFPQGDIALAMNEYAEVRSATRAIIGYENESDIKVVIAQHDEAKAEVEQLMAEIEKSIVTPEGKALFEEMNSALEAYYEKDAEIIEIGKSTDSAQSAKAQEMAINELTPLYNAADEVFTELMELNVQKGDTAQDQLLLMAVILIVLIVILMISAFLISTKLSIITAKGIIEPMHQLIDRLNGFAQGDISSPFPENDKDDEIGDMIKAVSSTTVKIQTIVNDMDDLLGKMAEGNFDIHSSCEEEYVGEFNGLLKATEKMNYEISATLNDMQNAADMVSAGSTNLAEASQALAEGATDQAASIEELQAMVSEISSSLEITTDKASSAYERATQCAQEVEKSHSEMEIMVDAMNKISETSKNIGNIIVEIEDIASQTNLLSLNAAIEAARAGEAGSGFAVVAEQIRILADQSAKSAVSTKQLIEESIDKVEIGSQSAVKTSETLMNVVELMKTIAENSKDISETVRRESESVKDADEGISQISEVVQSNSATAQETSATSEELSAQAISMDEIVGKFVLKQ
ncbi:MAG: MCP four helix bundle domain-containing protein [Lachnospiraceae bacterium]|nr:MCP four helix bundle domain-containing protein [Lachnospiraceae bacterium]MDE6251664.1 MCP four helix bundle domain-containing protein [Lachnospiraceae bacterium]